MSNIKISLIFACYNVSQYLQELYQLLVTQPYQNIEIIFVEDCSTDNTKELLRSFTDSRVKVIENTHNQGAAISRNIGITNATGEYIWFPDPDDLFDKNLIAEADQIMIMGHQYPDMDCVGGCLGIRRIAKMHCKTSWIITNPEQYSHDIKKLM